MQKRVKLPAEDVAEPYKASPHEVSALKEFLAKNEETPLAPRINVSETDGVTQIAFNHPEPGVAKILLMKALGTHNLDFLEGILHQLENATSGQTVNGRELNFMLAVIEGVKPKNQIETMLAAQMAVVHMATMAFGGHLARSGTIMQFEAAQRALCNRPDLCRASGSPQARSWQLRAQGDSRGGQDEPRHRDAEPAAFV